MYKIKLALYIKLAWIYSFRVGFVSDSKTLFKRHEKTFCKLPAMLKEILMYIPLKLLFQYLGIKNNYLDENNLTYVDTWPGSTNIVKDGNKWLYLHINYDILIIQTIITIFLSKYLSFYLSISVYLSIYLSVYIYLSTYLPLSFWAAAPPWSLFNSVYNNKHFLYTNNL